MTEPILAKVGKLKILSTSKVHKKRYYLVECECNARENVLARYVDKGEKKACIKCSHQGRGQVPTAILQERIEILEKDIDYIKRMVDFKIGVTT